MKFNGMFKTVMVAFLFSTILSQIPAQASDSMIVEAMQKSELIWDIDANEWKWVERTPVLTPVASIDGSTLIIENLVIGKDITIVVTDGYGQKVYENAVARISVTSIAISLDACPEGGYTLELRNALGGYLRGSFELF